MVNTVGFHFPKELDRLKKEKEIRETDGILTPQKAPTQMEVNSPTGNSGRDPGVKEKDRPKSQDKPKLPNDTSASINLSIASLVTAKNDIIKISKTKKEELIDELKKDNKRVTSKRLNQIEMDSILYALESKTDSTTASDILTSAIFAVKNIDIDNDNTFNAIIDMASYYLFSLKNN